MRGNGSAMGSPVWLAALAASTLGFLLYYPLLIVVWGLPEPALIPATILTLTLLGASAALLPAAAVREGGRPRPPSTRTAVMVGAGVAPIGAVLEFLTEGMYGLPGLFTVASAPWASLLVLIVTGRVVLPRRPATVLLLTGAVVVALLLGATSSGPSRDPGSLQLDGLRPAATAADAAP